MSGKAPGSPRHPSSRRPQPSDYRAIGGFQIVESGRIRFRRRSMVSNTPNSVSFSGLTEFRGGNSVSSSQPIICVPKRTHRVFCRTHRVCRRTHRGSVSSLLRNSTLETVFRRLLFKELNVLRFLRVEVCYCKGILT